MRTLIAGLALLFASGASAQTAQAPDWMSGYWLSCAEGVQTAENWIGAGSGVLLGANLTRGGYEFLRVAANERGGISYFSMPDGRTPPTEFVLVSHEGRRAVFENLAHDFPQRIVYQRDGATLHARIEDASGTQGMDWIFRRARADSNCRF